MAVGDHEGCVMAAAEEVRNVPEYGYRHKTAVGESRDVDFEQASCRILNSRYKTKKKKKNTEAIEYGRVSFLYLAAVAAEGISRRPTLGRPRPESLTWPAGRLRSPRFADLKTPDVRMCKSTVRPATRPGKGMV